MQPSREYKQNSDVLVKFFILSFYLDDITCDQLLDDRIVLNENDIEETDSNTKSRSTFYPYFGQYGYVCAVLWKNGLSTAFLTNVFLHLPPGASVAALTALMAAMYKWFLNE